MKLRYRTGFLLAALALASGLAATVPAATAAAPNGGGSPMWSPDGSKLAFLSGTPNTPVSVWLLDLRHKGSPRQLTRLGARALAWSANGKALYCQTMRGGESSFYSVDVATGRTRALLSFLPQEVTDVVWSSDRKKIAYVVKHSSHRDLWVSSMAGTGRARLTEGLNVRTADWSPDGKSLALDVGGVAGEKTYVVSADGKSEPKAVFTGIGSCPSWSPDGSKICVVGMHSVTVVNKDGSNQKRLHISQDDRRALDWSPNSLYLAYTAVDKDRRGISMVEVSSGKATRLSSGWAAAASPRWSPDGRYLAFEGAPAQGYTGNIYVLDIHRHGRAQLTTAGPSSWGSAWSGDGKSLYFISNAAGGTDFQVCRTGPDGKAFRSLFALNPTTPLQLHWPWRSKAGVLVTGTEIRVLDSAGTSRSLVTTEHPTWADLSPSGDTLAYVQWREHKPSLVLRKLAGGDEKEILPPPAAGLAYSHLAWSPRGDEIAFVQGTKICTVSVATHAVTVLSEARGKGQMAVLPPVWSPDGKWIVFGRVSRGSGEHLETNMVGAGGGRVVKVSECDLVAEPGTYAEPLQTPYAWSPDGKQLVYSREAKGRPALYLAPVARGAVGSARLLRSGAAYPAWAPDGTAIVYTALDGKQETIRVLQLRSGKDRPLRFRVPKRKPPVSKKGSARKK